MANAADAALESLSRAERPARMLLEGVLVVLLAILAARLVWLIFYPVSSVASFTDRPLAAPMTGTSSAFSLAADRTIIMRTNPFKSDSVGPILEAVPETNLNLQLDGLRMSDEGGSAGNAIIRTPNGIAKNYRVGDEIIAGVALEQIFSDRVIISRDGATETLMRGGRGEGLSVISDDSQAITPGEVETTTNDPTLPPITARIAGPEVLFTSLTAGPARTDAGLQGYRLSPRGDAAAMRGAGLEPGDVLLQFNGTSVAELDIDELLSRLGEVDLAILRVDRNGTERTIRLEIGE
ncbi:MAG: type II secretion system protein N [Henriciella sp.]